MPKMTACGTVLLTRIAVNSFLKDGMSSVKTALPEANSRDHMCAIGRWTKSNAKKAKQNFETYSVFHRFRKAKFAYGGSILSSSQFLLLPQLSQKMELASKVVKVDSKIIVWLPEI